jgi:hypothetical protein
VLHGIRWFGNYGELVIRLTNGSDADYDDFTADITADQRIQDLRQSGGLATCITESDYPWGAPTVQHFENGEPSGPAGEGGVVVRGQSQDYVALPLNKDGDILGRVAGFKIRCDKIQARDTIEFFGAVANWVVPKGPSASQCAEPSSPAKWVTVIAHFQTGSHGRNRSVLTCAVGSSCSSDNISANHSRYLRPFIWIWNRFAERVS